MKCICGGNSTLQKGSIEFNTHFLGKILVPDIEFLECDSCGDQLLTPEEGDKAIDYIANKEKELGIYRIKKKDGKWINANKGR